MVATIVPVRGSALKICNAIRKNRRVAKAQRPFNPGEFVFRRFCEFCCEGLLRCAEDVDREMAGVLENAHALRKDSQTPKHERRGQRTLTERGKAHPPQATRRRA